MANIEYLSPALPNLSSPLFSLNRAGHCTLSAGFHINRDDSYAFNNLHLVLSGSMTVRWHADEWQVHAGSLFLLPAYEPHHYRLESKQGELYWIEFYGGDAMQQVRQLLERNGPVFADAPESAGSGAIVRPGAPVECLMRQMIEVLTVAGSPMQQPQAGKLQAIEISRLIYGIFLSLWASVLPKDDLMAGLHNQQDDCLTESTVKSQIQAVAMAIEYIRQHPETNPTVRELAAMVRFNPTHFAKFFRRWTGSPPARFITAQKIMRARAMLAEDDRKISEIASELGFCNSSHFIRQFRQLAGQSPAACRTQNRRYRQPQVPDDLALKRQDRYNGTNDKR